MRGAVQDDQLLGLRSLLVLRANLRQSWSVAVGVIARHNEQRRAFELLGGTVWRGAQEHQPIDLTWLGSNRRGPGRPSSHAPPNDRHTLRSVLSEIMDGRQHIQVKWRAHQVGIAWPFRLADPAEIQGEHTKTRFGKGSSLLLPTCLIEAASVSQNDCAVPSFIKVCVNYAPIIRRKGNRLLRNRDGR